MIQVIVKLCITFDGRRFRWFSTQVWPYVRECDSKASSYLAWNYCAFHKHANFNDQKPPSQLRFSLPSILITITSNEPSNTETQKKDRNPPIRNHNPWPFEPVKVKFCFLRGPLRWLTAAKNAIVGFWTSEFACLWKGNQNPRLSLISFFLLFYSFPFFLSFFLFFDSTCQTMKYVNMNAWAWLLNLTLRHSPFLGHQISKAFLDGRQCVFHQQRSS